MFMHPWNFVFKGSIMQTTGMYACTVAHDCFSERSAIVMERKHGYCELYRKAPEPKSEKASNPADHGQP